MAKYNGWTNWETWKTNLELFQDEEPDGYDEDILECWDGKKWNKSDLMTVSDGYAEYLQQIVEDYAENEKLDSFTESIINSFIKEINFQEIAENIIDNYKDSLI
jgi:hypothetical protein